MDRRTLIGLGAALLAGTARAQSVSAPQDSTEIVPLWPIRGGPRDGATPALHERFTGPAGDRIATGIASPFLSIVRPANPDGSGLMIIPGGGYMQEMIDLEGGEIAKRLSDSGVTCFVLRYRLPNEGWPRGPFVVLEDAQRAMRILRARAGFYGIDASRTGVLGFSAGGHLAATLATRFAESVYRPIDAIDKADARPSFIALGYPVVSMLAPLAHEASCEHLLGRHAAKTQREAWSCERHVGKETPPAFLFACTDDPFVPVANTTSLFHALHAKNVPAEMHVFERGGHSFGVRLPKTMPASAWPDLLLAWGRSHGIFRVV